jgi:2-hydroxychromene-2-carboxylate isomerase
MSLDVDVFWSFRSPYSYLATPRLVRLAAEYDVAVNVRVVQPIAIRIPGFFETVNPLWPPYLLRDTRRIAEYERIPYRWPRPDPIVPQSSTRKVAAARLQQHGLRRRLA